MIYANLATFEQKLIEHKLVTAQQLSELKASSEFLADGLFETLLSQKTISPDQLYQTAAKVWSVPFIQLDDDGYNKSNIFNIPGKILRELEALTLTDKHNRHLVAFGSPEKLARINQLGFFTQQELTPVLANINLIRKSRNQQHHQQNNRPSVSANETELKSYLEKSTQLNASDIHIEMFNGHCSLRVRVDGILHPLASISAACGLRLISQIKLKANMDIAQSRLPQDGRFTEQLKFHGISLRVNSMPTIHGEKLVLRILEQHGKQFKLNRIGLFAEQYQLIREILQQPSGLVLVSGPTGSGKTVTLYALLDLLNTGKENISTIEDPAEIHVEGINQVSINRKAGLNFSTALRALLRQDPDIIMIGEIRDTETAEIAVKAAQTGHLVLATLHSRTARGAQTRLLQLGINQYLLDDALRLTVAQRLMRKLCRHCYQRSEVSKSAIQLISEQNLTLPKYIYTAVGCPTCLQGYQDRTGIFELLPQGQEVESGLFRYSGLQHAGLRHVIDGNTSLDELLRVV